MRFDIREWLRICWCITLALFMVMGLVIGVAVTAMVLRFVNQEPSTDYKPTTSITTSFEPSFRFATTTTSTTVTKE